MRWNFSVPIHETFCSVQVGYLDFVEAIYETSKNCSYSGKMTMVANYIIIVIGAYMHVYLVSPYCKAN